MNELNTKQLKVIEQVALNAGTVVLGTMILGLAIQPGSFNLISFVAGLIIYSGLIWVALKVNQRRKM